MKRIISIPSTFVALTAFAVCTASLSAKEKKAKDPSAAFDKADTDSNGELTKEEVKAAKPKMDDAALDKMFTAKDTDGNGTLSKEEYSAGGKGKKAKGGGGAGGEEAGGGGDE